ncbi:hypothetical protein FS749_008609 [Ceratobasidium sp. UAMH 11750]|nr:hypothetical protein FS749_008609 [Ceratobasidium sp. UAMH 11750]
MPPPKALPAPTKPVQLASKEQALFKELLSLYETRQYKKAVKTADTILKKVPAHGETMCMKGLVFTNMPGKRDEGVELVRKGLALGLESHICWHVYGLVLKSDKNYAQALGAYNRALKYDVDNMNILRDAAQLQMQLRLYDQLVQTRHTLLELRPTMRQSWVALAVAYQISANGTNGDATPEPPTTYLWTLYYLAQHYSYCGDQSKALAILDTAIEHTPTLPELYLARGRALKRAGDYVGAFAAVEAARALDGQDRWLNGKSAKYALRAGRLEDAQALLGMFTRKDAVSPAADLQEMQSLVFLIQEGEAFRRAGKLPMALKRFSAVAQVFDDIWDDQFDFHSYCIRRYTLGTYSDTIDWEDGLKGHAAYRKAAVEAAKIYIRLHDEPGLIAACTPKLSAAEKKAKAKATKVASKEPKKPAPNAKDDEIQPPKDEDPDGLKAFSQPKPLDQALKLLRPLETLGVKDIDVWLAVYDVAMRRQKHLQALKALNTAKSISPDHYELHWRVVDFRLQTSSESVASSLDTSIKSVIESSLPNLIPLEQSPEAFNAEYLQRHTNPRAKLGGALAVLRIHGHDTGRAEAEDLIFQMLHPEANASVQDCLEGLRILCDVLKSERADEFRTASAGLFLLSTAMRTSQELEALRNELAGASQKVEEAKPLQVPAEEESDTVAK